MKKKNIIFILSILTLALTLCGCGGTEKESSSEVTVGENQELSYGIVTGINGNEITYKELDASMAEAIEERAQGEKNTDSQNKDTSNSGQKQQGMEPPSGGGEGMTPPSGDGEGMTPPSRDEEGMTPPTGEDAPQMPSGEDNKTSKKLSGEDSENSENSSEEGTETEKGAQGKKEETITTSVPVGVTVHTSTGTDTTFSRIAVGDMLKILLEKDEDGNMVIVEIWMM